MWIYGLCLAVVLPAVFIVARSPDFVNYYPFYKQASRSWFDLIFWELMYFAQFFALEIFFRGFWLSGLRNTLGSERLESCALGQIREWRFPPVPKGVTTFQAPFVFTPPN